MARTSTARASMSRGKPTTGKRASVDAICLSEMVWKAMQEQQQEHRRESQTLDMAVVEKIAQQVVQAQMEEEGAQCDKAPVIEFKSVAADNSTEESSLTHSESSPASTKSSNLASPRKKWTVNMDYLKMRTTDMSNLRSF